MKGFTTTILHTPYVKDDPHHALRVPIYKSVAYEFNSAEEIANAFEGKLPSHTYSRASNPTVEHFETIVRHLTGANGVLAVASGMAAISCALLSLLRQGDNFITTYSLFGNTLSLFDSTFAEMGIEARFADCNSIFEMEKVLDKNTRLVFVETISNPGIEVVDIKKLAAFCRENNIILVVDSTVTPFCFFNAKDHGVDIEIVSSTKFISGGATSVGGVIIDYATYDYGAVPKLESFAGKFGKMAFIAKLRKEIYRNIGACLSPDNAYLQTLGIETLRLRAEKSSCNAQHVAEWLQGHIAVIEVRYPGLGDSSCRAVAKSQFGKYFGGVLAFDLKDKEGCFTVLNKLTLIRRATNLNDNKTLAIHPASTIYCEFTKEQLMNFNIADNTIRLSVGIEEVEDIINDLSQALSI